MKTIKLRHIIFVLALLAAQNALADTITVTSTADDGSPGTLREVLAAASDGDTINITATGTIALDADAGPLVVNKSVAITGPGPAQLTIDGQNATTVFEVGMGWNGPIPGVIVEISGLTIANGHDVDFGGGVKNAGTLTLSGCTLRGNSGGYGGAIVNMGTLTLSDCTLSGNFAENGGGAIVNGDPFGTGYSATLLITHCTLSDNSVQNFGWGGGSGGAIFSVTMNTSGAVTIENSTLNGNTAPIGGGIAIWTVGSAASPANVAVAIRNSTLTGNSAGISDQPLSYGGGIFVLTGGDNPAIAGTTLTLENSTLSLNFASRSRAASGGGIFSVAAGGSTTVNVKNSTLSGNWASAEGNGVGGGIYNLLSSASGSAFVNVDNSTLSGNWDDGFVGGIANEGGTVNIKNTILDAGQSGANLALNGGTSLSSGYNLSSDDGGGFLTATGDQINTDPILGPLADNGGPTWTHALLPGSPAIDTGSSTDIAENPVTADQRGVARPQGAGYDIGAFELASQQYSWSGVLQPVNADGTSVFKAGSTIPIKFRLTGWSAGITDLVATLSYAMVSNGVVGQVNETFTNAGGDTGNQFRYDATAGQYVYNWSTKGLTAGTYRLFINLGDGVERIVDLGLR